MIKYSVDYLNLTLAMAKQDVKNKYRRSKIGQLWNTITLGFTILCIGLIYGSLLKGNDQSGSYYAYFATGYIIWSYLSTTLTEFVEVYQNNSHYIKNVRIPYTVYILRVIIKNSIFLFHNFIILIILYFFNIELLSVNLVIVVPGLILLFLFCFGAGNLIALICARYRDFAPLFQTAIQFGFFVTPILWYPASIASNLKFFVHANPLYYFIEIVREPMLGVVPSLNAYIISMGIVAVTLSFSSFVNLKYSKKIAYWL